MSADAASGSAASGSATSRDAISGAAPGCAAGPRVRGPLAGLAVAAAAAAVLAVAAPYPVAAFGVALLGPLHVLLAVRYLTGRVSGAVRGPAARLLVAAVAAMALVRAFAVVDPPVGQLLETAGGVAVLSVAMLWGLRGAWRSLALLPLLLLGAGALAQTSWYWFALTHAHNLVPLVFLWDWARRYAPATRWAFTGACAALMLGFPVAVLVGLVDPSLGTASAGLVAGFADPLSLVAGVSHHGMGHELSARLFAAFVFLQLFHYALWVGFFQLRGRVEAVRSPLPSGRRFWLLAGGVTLLCWVGYAVGYADGRALYAVLGALNVALEQPIAVWLLLTALPGRATTSLVAELRTGEGSRGPAIP